MKESKATTAVGTFAGESTSWGAGFTARPVRNGEALAVEMPKVGGTLEPYVVPYFLGHRPIEQHLTEFPGGRLQALPIGFDTSRREWFDIFEGDAREPSDWGHWTNRGMNANSQCLYCHTTGFRKGYIPDSDEYRTHWAEMAVGCEACHGPGAAHVSAREKNGTDSYTPVKGEAMVDVCASCHALRREIQDGFTPGARLLDHFEPDHLDADIYYPDGQIRQESYEWGSFVQSAMYRAGVTCTACHDVHSTNLKQEGNALCLGCHDAHLAAPEHTHHASGSSGSECIACHMPPTVYMTRDSRRDHSFSLPDPQLTLDLGIPNACQRCHADKPTEWAADHVKGWGPASAKVEARRSRAQLFARARRGDPDTVDGLLECVRSCDSVYVRASSIRLLARFTARPDVAEALTAALSSEHPLVRAGAAWAISEADVPATAPLLRATRDDVRAVRLHTAWALRAIAPADVSAEDQRAVAAALDEWRSSMKIVEDQPETLHTLGVFHADRGELDEAERAYRAALKLTPDSVPPRYNLAMLLGQRGDVDGAERELLEIRERDPGFAPAAYALGTLYADKGRWEDAAVSFQQCLQNDPAYPGALGDLAHAYVKLDRANVAKVMLQTAAQHPPARKEALRALVAVNLELGDEADARRWAREATRDDAELAGDPRVRALLDN
jgi:predicted CXXCH cytochrome family protein